MIKLTIITAILLASCVSVFFSQKGLMISANNELISWFGAISLSVGIAVTSYFFGESKGIMRAFSILSLMILVSLSISLNLSGNVSHKFTQESAKYSSLKKENKAYVSDRFGRALATQESIISDAKLKLKKVNKLISKARLEIARNYHPKGNLRAIKSHNKQTQSIESKIDSANVELTRLLSLQVTDSSVKPKAQQSDVLELTPVFNAIIGDVVAMMLSIFLGVVSTRIKLNLSDGILRLSVENEALTDSVEVHSKTSEKLSGILQEREVEITSLKAKLKDARSSKIVAVNEQKKLSREKVAIAKKEAIIENEPNHNDIYSFIVDNKDSVEEVSISLLCAAYNRKTIEFKSHARKAIGDSFSDGVLEKYRRHYKYAKTKGLRSVK